MDLEALSLTLRLASTTTLLLLVVALPLALWIGARPSPLRAIVQSLTTLPLVLPPTVLGFYLLVALGPRTALGRELTRLLGHPLAFSFSGLLVGSAIYSLPFAVQPIVAALQAMDTRLLEAAAALGASPARILREITLPLVRPSLLTAAVLTFTHTVGEFGVVLMLGGNIPGSTRTLSISMYDLVEEGRDAESNRTALVLVAFALAALLTLYLVPIVRRRSVRHGSPGQPGVPLA